MYENNSSTKPYRGTASTSSTADWSVFISRIAERDQDALAQFYDASRRQVFGLLMRILSDEATAEEVLLDVYMQVWRQAPNYDRSRGAPQAWVVTIARSRAIDRLRAGRHDVQLKEPLDESRVVAAVRDNTDLAAESEQRRYVRDALDALPAEQRTIIELAYFQGMSQAEIAIHLNQPLGTIKTRTRLGMAKLRERLRPVMEGRL